MGIINAFPDYYVDNEPTVSTILSENTPDVIKWVADNGLGETYWNVGDKTSPITISSSADLPNFTPPSEGVCAFILGFDHNSQYEGIGIHFQFGKTVAGMDVAFVDSGCGATKTSGTWFNINNSNSNSGGWASSHMRTTVIPAFISALPLAWQEVISDTIKYSDNTGGGSNTASYVTATTDKMFLISEFEARGGRTNANSAEQNYQQQYDYYKNGNSKVKYKHNDTSTACCWWLRSVYASDATHFCTVGSDGYTDSYSASVINGFAPGFKIGGDSV